MATKTLNIALDVNLLKAIDNAVKKDMGTRSEYFRRLALNDLEKRGRWNQIMETGQIIRDDMNITSEDQMYSVLND